MDLTKIESAADNMAELLGDMIARDKNDLTQSDTYDPNIKYSEPIAALAELIEIVESSREVKGSSTPMTPDEWPEDDDNLYYYYTCPCCEKTVFEGQKKCLCGQVLDWSGIK